jgi:hypothetical protein
MAGITIMVSKEFHDWLKSKGNKGESYEDVLKRVIKADFLRSLKQDAPVEPKKSEVFEGIVGQKKTAGTLPKIPTKQRVMPDRPPKITLEKSIESTNISTETILESMGIKRADEKPSLKRKKKIGEKSMSKKQGAKSSAKPANNPANSGLDKWKSQKNIELQRLRAEIEKAKMSNNIKKIRQLAVSIAKLRKDVSS